MCAEEPSTTREHRGPQVHVGLMAMAFEDSRSIFQWQIPTNTDSYSPKCALILDAQDLKIMCVNTNLCVVFSHSLDITVPASYINKMCNGAFRLFRSFMLLLGELEGKVTLHHGHVPIWETMWT